MMSGTSTAPQIKAGRLRALAFTGPQRSRILPEVPAIAEFYPDFVMVQWYGLFAPAGTPEAALARLRTEVKQSGPRSRYQGKADERGRRRALDHHAR